MSLVRVPAGEFIMGTSAAYWTDSIDSPDKKPQHKVYLDEYLIGKFQVTVAQFRVFVEDSGYEADSRALRTGYDDHPVTNVSWNCATAFCRWASQVTGRTVRLPTEAEWEKAARGIDGRNFPWGNQAQGGSSCNFNYKVGNTMPVGHYSPKGDSPYGCADMSGDVCEWVNDWYSSDYYACSPGINPQGPTNGSSRVLRGGSQSYDYGNSYDYVRVVARFKHNPDDLRNYISFRCAVFPGD
jgi:sulfatase modifying factor 1